MATNLGLFVHGLDLGRKFVLQLGKGGQPLLLDFVQPGNDHYERFWRHLRQI